MIISFTLSISLIGLIIINQFDILSKQSYYIISYIILLLRQIIGFIWLAYLPGALIIRTLKIYEINNIEKLVYSVGLSLSIVMITGFLINIIYPIIGISRPFSIWPLLLTFSGINLLISATNYWHSKKNNSLKITYLVSKKSSLLQYLLLPILATIGAKFVDTYNNNTILMCLIILIPVILIVTVTTEIIKESAYPSIIYMIALALLLHTTMVSPYPMRINVDAEYLYQQLVVQNEYWNYKIPVSTNISLSTIMIAPIFSKVLNIDTFGLFKYIYPIIFSLVPLTLYQVYSKQIDKKYAFLSVCFFMFYLYYYLEAPLLRRQQIAILYFTLVMLLFMNHNILLYKKRILYLIFIFSLIVSHTSTALFCIILFVFAYLFATSKNIEYIRNQIFRKLQNIKIQPIDYNYYENLDINKTQLSRSLIILFGAALISWLLYMGSGRVFNMITLFSQAVYLDFFDQPGKSAYISQALGAGFFDVSINGKIYRLLQYLSQIFILIGTITVIVRPKNFSIEYFQMIISSSILLIFAIIAPYVSTWINIFRIYHILLLIISPLCIIGAKTIYKSCLNGIKSILYKESCNKKGIFYDGDKQSYFLKIFVIFFLIPYLLYNVGFVFEIGNFNEETSQLAKIPKSPSLTYNYDSGYHSEQEVLAAKRIADIINKNYPIYGDAWIGYDLISSWNNNSKMLYDTKEITSNYHYIFFREGNIISKKYTINSGGHPVELNLELLNHENQIYNNGNALVLGVFS